MFVLLYFCWSLWPVAFATPSTPGNPCQCPSLSAQDDVDCSAWAHEPVPTGTAEQNLASVWEKVFYDQTSNGFMDQVSTLYWAANSSYLREMANPAHGDERNQDHQKITHGIAGHAKAHFEWCKDTPYTGLFQKAEHCLIRIANAAEPSSSWLNPTAFNPNMAIKCFRDQAPSANLQTIWEIDGYNVIPEGLSKSCSYFETPLSNHCGERPDINMALGWTFINWFNNVDPNSMMLGVSQMAESTQEGDAVAAPYFPFALVFVPHPDLNSVPCSFEDVARQLKNIDSSWIGKPIYEIYAVENPWTARPAGQPILKFVGHLILDSSFFTSKYGDTRLFFRHTFFQEELQELRQHGQSQRADVWAKFADRDTSSNYQHEGANLYWPFLPRSPGHATC